VHEWGDDWEHWDELYNAIEYFNRVYERVTGNCPITKEKYGTMRFEMTPAWIKSDSDVRAFKHILQRMVKKFPNVTGEIFHDASHVKDDPYFEGWCSGVAYKSNGFYWVSNDRPKGV